MIHALSDETHLMDCIEAADVVPSGEQGIGLRLLISLYRTDPHSVQQIPVGQRCNSNQSSADSSFGNMPINSTRLREGAGTSTSPQNNLTGGIFRCGLGKVPARQYHSNTTAKAQRNGEISSVEDTTVRTWCGWSAGPPNMIG